MSDRLKASLLRFWKAVAAGAAANAALLLVTQLQLNGGDVSKVDWYLIGTTFVTAVILAAEKYWGWTPAP